MENKCKRYLSLLLALVMVIGLMPVGHAHAEGETFMVIGEKATTVEANGVYVICLTGTMQALTNQQGSNAWGTHTLVTAVCSDIAEAKNMWTLESAEGGYKLHNANGYLAVSRNTAELNETGHVFEFVYSENGWAIKSLETNEYFNNLGSTGSIGGWSGDGTKFDLYSVVETPAEEADPFGKLRGLWSKVSVDTETVYDANEGLFEYAFDNNLNSIWHSNWQGASDKLTGENTFAGVIDLGAAYTISRFSFTPRQGNNSGQVTQASLYVKETEEAEWILVAEHATFAADQSKKDMDFEAQAVRYVKFVAEQSNDGWVAVAEFDVDYLAPVHQHSYTAEVTTAATCTTEGEMTYTCTGCGDVYTEVIPATGHQNTVIVGAVKPTLTEEGYTGDTYCNDCQQTVATGETIPVRQILNALLSGGNVVTLTDCEYTYTAEGKLAHTGSDGQTIYICLSGSTGKLPGSATDGDVAVAEPQEGSTAVHLKLGERYLHFYSKTTPGWDRCGSASYSDHANGTHNVYLFVAVEEFDPDSLIPGYTQVTTLTEGGKYLVVGAHDNGNYYVLYPTTSGTAGDHIAQLVTDEVTHVHSWVEATCTAPKTCSACGETEGEALGHAYEAVVTAPTCTEGGYTTYTCSRCGDSYVADETEALGHTEEVIPAVAPTCTETGLTEGKKCSVCGEVTVAQEVVPATGHTEEVIPAVAATCTETGLTEGKKCAVCGEIIVAQEVVPATGHTEEIIPAVAPTCTETGLTEGKKCNLCGEITVAQEVVDALGHDFVDGSCTRCGEADPDYAAVIATGWSGYTTWVLTADGTLTFSPTASNVDGETNLRNYCKVDGVLTLPWSGYAEQITKVVVEEGIHDIGQMAFYELPNLVEVVLPESIVEIRGYAFKNCKSLTTINLEGVDFIREGAFYGCSALENVTFAAGVVIEDWAFSRTPVVLP